MKLILMVGFSGILGTGQVEDQKMIKNKLIRDTGSIFDDYLISPKVRQILLQWGYELTEKDFLMS